TATNAEGTEVDEQQSYKLHIEKLKNILKLLNDQVTGDDLITFGKILNEFYIAENLWFVNPTIHKDELRATQLENEDYPILS
ncbi:virulence factor, partial [Streptococcus anginosus]|nr:virulence factor [Streptococcus anginosus]